MLQEYFCSLLNLRTADTATVFTSKSNHIDVEPTTSKPSYLVPPTSSASLEMDLNKLIYLSTQQHTISKANQPGDAPFSLLNPSQHTLSVITPTSSAAKAAEHIKVEQSDSGTLDLTVQPQHRPTTTNTSSNVASAVGEQFTPAPAAISTSTATTTTNNNSSSGGILSGSSKSASSQLEHVLQRFQQSATMTLNGPSSGDWFNYSRSLAAASANPNTEAATVAAALELAKSSRNITATSNNIASSSATTASGGDLTTLDLRVGHRAAPSTSTAAGHSHSASKDTHPFPSYLSNPPFPIQKPPLLTPSDQDNACERSETFIEGENIACFNIGGEKRLCFPQIINIVLSTFTYQDIVDAIKELHIYSAVCSPEQMEVLKRFHDIPVVVPSCGLITKTDAHRLCSTLLSASSAAVPPNVDFARLPREEKVIAVYHECFGRTTGLYVPSLYDSEVAKCIQCEECRGLFTPAAFVSHSHRARGENRTCHWGFDPANWRHYILPVEDCTYDDRALPTGSAADFVPACSGGRKAFKAKVKAAAASISPLDAANIEGAYHNKSVLAARKILKDMKQKFATDSTGASGNASSRRTHSVGSASTVAAVAAAKRKLEEVSATSFSCSPLISTLRKLSLFLFFFRDKFLISN